MRREACSRCGRRSQTELKETRTSCLASNKGGKKKGTAEIGALSATEASMQLRLPARPRLPVRLRRGRRRLLDAGRLHPVLSVFSRAQDRAVVFAGIEVRGVKVRLPVGLGGRVVVRGREDELRQRSATEWSEGSGLGGRGEVSHDSGVGQSGRFASTRGL